MESLKSEEKCQAKVKDTNQTNPTSESSSMKCSSIASQQENKHAEPASQMTKHRSQNYNDGVEWITSASKKKGSKNKKNQKGGKNTNRKNKNNKNKNKQNKKQHPDEIYGKDDQPDSIWAENIEQTILSSDTPVLQKAKTHEVPKAQTKPVAAEEKTQKPTQNLKQKSKSKNYSTELVIWSDLSSKQRALNFYKAFISIQF